MLGDMSYAPLRLVWRYCLLLSEQEIHIHALGTLGQIGGGYNSP